MDMDNFRSGFVAVIGRPNVGKSTLVNALIGNKISIISKIPQTTRYQVKGILNVEGAQVVFVDTPGIHSFQDKLALHLNTIAKRSLDGCDLILYVVDVSRNLGKEEERIMKLLSPQKRKVIMVLNKMDLGKEFLSSYLQAWKEQCESYGKDPVLFYLPLSALNGKNVGTLKSLIVDNLPQQPAFYDLETKTDFPLKFRVADIVRERLFCQLQKEIPHSLAVEVEEIEDEERLFKARIIIYVLRQSQKKIVVGKGGGVLKEVGTQARGEIEKIVGKKVYLDLWVKVLEDWQESPRILKELGYWWA